MEAIFLLAKIIPTPLNLKFWILYLDVNDPGGEVVLVEPGPTHTTEAGNRFFYFKWINYTYITKV